jgi:hypothetical protein
MEQTPGAMKLRTLQTIDRLGAGPSNTVVMFPVELTETMKRLVESLPQKNSGIPVSSQALASSIFGQETLPERQSTPPPA